MPGFSSPLPWNGLNAHGLRELRQCCTPIGNFPQTDQYSFTVPANAKPTQPYFTRPGIEQPYYDIVDASLRGQPESQYPLTAWATVQYSGMDITLGQVVQTAHRVVGQGTVYQPLVIVPAISVALAPAGRSDPAGCEERHADSARAYGRAEWQRRQRAA